MASGGSVCCLLVLGSQIDFWQKQQKSPRKAELVAFVRRLKEAGCRKGNKIAAEGRISCLWPQVERSLLSQKQQNSPRKAKLVAFGQEPEEAGCRKGNKKARGRSN